MPTYVIPPLPPARLARSCPFSATVAFCRCCADSPSSARLTTGAAAVSSQPTHRQMANPVDTGQHHPLAIVCRAAAAYRLPEDRVGGDRQLAALKTCPRSAGDLFRGLGAERRVHDL